MSSRSDSITWQGWSQKWGDWTTWFRKTEAPLKPLERGLVLPMTTAQTRGQNVRTQRQLLKRDQSSTHLE